MRSSELVEFQLTNGHVSIRIFICSCPARVLIFKPSSTAGTYKLSERFATIPPAFAPRVRRTDPTRAHNVISERILPADFSAGFVSTALSAEAKGFIQTLTIQEHEVESKVDDGRNLFYCFGVGQHLGHPLHRVDSSPSITE